MARASGRGLMPICCPSCPTSRTSRARIRSLIRGSLLAGGVAIAKSCSCRRWFLLCAEWAVLPGADPENERGGRRRMPTSASTSESTLSLVDDLVDPAHRGWPGGGKPRFPMQLWDVGYGHVTTRHNPAERDDEPVDARRRPPGRPPGPDADRADPRPPEDLSAEEQAQLEAMQAEMERGAPAARSRRRRSVVIANHAMGIYELAAIHLTRRAAEAHRGACWRSTPSPPSSRGSRAASARPSRRCARRSPSSGPPTWRSESRDSPGRATALALADLDAGRPPSGPCPPGRTSKVTAVPTLDRRGCRRAIAVQWNGSDRRRRPSIVP